MKERCVLNEQCVQSTYYLISLQRNGTLGHWHTDRRAHAQGHDKFCCTTALDQIVSSTVGTDRLAKGGSYFFCFSKIYLQGNEHKLIKLLLK